MKRSVSRRDVLHGIAATSLLGSVARGADIPDLHLDGPGVGAEMAGTELTTLKWVRF